MSSIKLDDVLTIGASGLIGSYVDFGTRPSKEELDILDEAAVARYVEDRRPGAILLLAGATDMKRCEEDPAYAYELNVRGAYTVARAARMVGATVVYASTSRVFKGDKDTPYEETDMPDPQTAYARTKYFGELVTAAIAPRHIIARTAWVFGGGPLRDDKFYGKMLRQLRTPGADVVALNDVHGSPTYGKDYIAALKSLITEGASGTFHIANEGVATRYETAEVMARELKTKVAVRAVDRSYFPDAALPANEAIVSGTVRLRSWQEALSEYLSTEWA